MNKRSVLSALGVAVAVVGGSFLAAPHRFTGNLHFLFASIALALTVGNLSLAAGSIYEARGEAGPTAALGIRIRFSLAAVVLGIAAVALALTKYRSGADLAGFMGVLLIGFSMKTSSAVAEKVSEINERVSAPSRHLTWRDDLDRIAAVSKDDELRRRLQVLAEESRFLARDVPGVETEVDHEIAGRLLDIRRAVLAQEFSEASALLDTLSTLFAEREILLRSERRKA